MPNRVGIHNQTRKTCSNNKSSSHWRGEICCRVSILTQVHTCFCIGKYWIVGPSLNDTTVLLTTKDVFSGVWWSMLAKSCIILFIFAHESKVLCSKLCSDGGIMLLIINYWTKMVFSSLYIAIVFYITGGNVYDYTKMHWAWIPKSCVTVPIQ